MIPTFAVLARSGKQHYFTTIGTNPAAFAFFALGGGPGLPTRTTDGRSGGQMVQVASATMAFSRRENRAAVAGRGLAGRQFPIEIFSQA
jgi:hypothetical protein